jgi:hypothetical protein
MAWGPYLIAAAVAYAVTVFDLWSSTYPRTLGFLFRCPSAHGLAAVYAVVAGLLLLLFGLVVAPNLQGDGEAGKALIGKFLVVLVTYPLLKGAFVGAFANGLANFKLFNIPSPNGPTPIGAQTLMLMFEPLKESVVIEHHVRVRSFCGAWLQRIGKSDPDLPTLKLQAIAAVPGGYSADRKAAIKVTFDETTQAVDLLQKGVERLGAEWVRRTFT